MENINNLTRRDFLKITGLGAAALALPGLNCGPTEPSYLPRQYMQSAIYPENHSTSNTFAIPQSLPTTNNYFVNKAGNSINNVDQFLHLYLSFYGGDSLSRNVLDEWYNGYTETDVYGVGGGILIQDKPPIVKDKIKAEMLVKNDIINPFGETDDSLKYLDPKKLKEEQFIGSNDIRIILYKHKYQKSSGGAIRHSWEKRYQKTLEPGENIITNVESMELLDVDYVGGNFRGDFKLAFTKRQ